MIRRQSRSQSPVTDLSECPNPKGHSGCAPSEPKQGHVTQSFPVELQPWEWLEPKLPTSSSVDLQMARVAILSDSKFMCNKVNQTIPPGLSLRANTGNSLRIKHLLQPSVSWSRRRQEKSRTFVNTDYVIVKESPSSMISTNTCQTPTATYFKGAKSEIARGRHVRYLPWRVEEWRISKLTSTGYVSNKTKYILVHQNNSKHSNKSIFKRPCTTPSHVSCIRNLTSSPASLDLNGITGKGSAKSPTIEDPVEQPDSAAFMTLCVSLGFNLQGIIPCLIQPLINLHRHRYNYKRKYWHNHHVKKEERRVCLSPAFSIAWLSQTQRSVRSRRDRHALHPSPRSRNKCRDDPGVLDFLLVKTSDWSMLFLH